MRLSGKVGLLLLLLFLLLLFLMLLLQREHLFDHAIRIHFRRLVLWAAPFDGMSATVFRAGRVRAARGVK